MATRFWKGGRLKGNTNTHLHQNASNFLFSSVILSSDQLGLLIWAVTGGAFVFIGLVIEKVAEWMNDNFLGGWNAHKKLGEIGWVLLMVGIAIEIADAGFAANEGWQTKQTAIKNDPSRQPIVLATATVTLSIGPTNSPKKHLHSKMLLFGRDSDPQPNFSWDTKQVFVELILTNSTARQPQMIILRCLNSKISDSMIIDGQSRFIMTLNFEINSMENLARELEARQMFPSGTLFPPRDILSVHNFDEDGLASLFSKSTFPDGFEIKAGTCSIRFNSSVERNFNVPQNARGDLMVLIKETN